MRSGTFLRKLAILFSEKMQLDIVTSGNIGDEVENENEIPDSYIA